MSRMTVTENMRNKGQQISAILVHRSFWCLINGHFKHGSFWFSTTVFGSHSLILWKIFSLSEFKKNLTCKWLKRIRRDNISSISKFSFIELGIRAKNKVPFKTIKCPIIKISRRSEIINDPVGGVTNGGDTETYKFSVSHSMDDNGKGWKIDSSKWNVPKSKTIISPEGINLVFSKLPSWTNSGTIDYKL